MEKFYRCNDPTGVCELSKTREIIAGSQWKCPCANASCESTRQQVSPWEARAKILKVIMFGSACLFILVIGSYFLRSDPLKEKLEILKKTVSDLDARLGSLESRPKENETEKLPLRRLQELLGKVKGIETTVLKSRKDGLPKLPDEDEESLSAILKQASELGQAGNIPPPSSGTRIMEIRQLVNDYQNAEQSIEEVRNQFQSTSQSKFANDYDLLTEDVRTGMNRALRLGRPPKKPDTVEFIALTKQIEDVVAKIRLIPPPLAPPPKLPFLESDATLRIATTSDLAETMIAPLLLAKTGGKIERHSGQLFYSSKTGDGNMENVIVSMISEQPFQKLIEGKTDLLVTEREPSENSRQAFKVAFPDSSLDSRSHAEVIAMDAMTFLTHPDNPLSVLHPSDLSNSLRFMGTNPSSEEGSVANRFGLSIQTITDKRLADAVLSDPNCVGLGAYHLEGANIRAKRLAFQAAPEALALKPSPFTIATEDYKYSFRITAFNTPRSKPSALEFVRFITSDTGQRLISDNGYVDLRLRSSGADADPRILAALGSALGIENVRGALRLSTNFRFESGVDKFDLKALADLERVPVQLAKDYPAAKIAILGFTDNTGGPKINLPLSQRRAESVAFELRKHGLEIKTGGMGDQFAVDANDTEAGKARNRRSEIWVVP